MKHSNIFSWFLPQHCLWCQLATTSGDEHLCNFCHQALPKLTLACVEGNALALPAIAKGLTPRHFDRLYSLSWYQLPWSHWIGRWKFQQDFACGALLCQQLQQACQHYLCLSLDLPQAVCFVPISRQRKQQRGFNQAEVLASVIATTLNRPLLRLFIHQGHRTHQVGLNRQQRSANLRRQFRLHSHDIPYTHLLLVDDVITTGATINRLCTLLRRAGVSQIDVWTLAVTPAERRRPMYTLTSNRPS